MYNFISGAVWFGWVPEDVAPGRNLDLAEP